VLLGIHWEKALDEPPRRVLAEIERRGIESERAWISSWGGPALVKMTGMTTASHLSNRERNTVSTTPLE
jgi:hypothetical protein